MTTEPTPGPGPDDFPRPIADLDFAQLDWSHEQDLTPDQEYVLLVNYTARERLLDLSFDPEHPGAPEKPVHEVKHEAYAELDEARDTYAQELANRRSNLLINNGRSINRGMAGRLPFRRGLNVNKLDENSGFQYDVAKAVARQIAIAEVDDQGTNQEVIARKKLAVLDQLLGADGPDGDEQGELFKLAEAVKTKRLLNSKFYVENEHGEIIEKTGGNVVAERTRDLRRKFYEKWNKWTAEDGKKGMAKRAGTLAAGGAVLGLGFGVAGAGLAVAGAAVGASRVVKSFATTHIEKKSGALKAEVDTEQVMVRLRDVKDRAYQSLAASDDQDLDDFMEMIPEDELVRGTHTKEANKEARKNAGRVAVALAVSTGAALLASELKDLVQDQLHQESLADRVRDVFGGYEEKPQIFNGLDYPGGPSPVIQLHDNHPKVVKHAAKHLLHKVKGDYSGRFVSEVYQAHDGKKDGFLHMISAAHKAIVHGDLTKVQPDASNPDRFWYKVTKKGAKKFSHMATGSSNTKDVLSVLKPYNG